MAGLVGATGLLFNVNCGSSGGTGAGGTGGHAGTGGIAGAAGHAGTTGTGGTSTAGNGGSAGAAAGNGGSAGNGGAAGGAGGAAGGAAGSAGHAGGASGAAGGAAGSNTDGGTATSAFAYNFDTTAQGYVLNDFPGAGNIVNLDGGVPPILTWDGTAGHPTAGSLKVDATFTDFDQFVFSSINLSPFVDATGKTAQAYVMVDAVDGGASFPGSAQLVVKSTTSYTAANGANTALTPGVWKLLTLDLTTQAPPFDASEVIQFGVSFSTNSATDGGAFGPAVHAVFHIDSITDGSGGSPPPELNDTFDRTADTYGITASVADASVPPVLTWDGTVGVPSPGSLELTADFTDYSQSVDTAANIYPPINVMGMTIHAKVRLDTTDAGSTFTSGYAQVHASSAGYLYSNGARFQLTPGVWTDVTEVLANPNSVGPTFDPTQIIQVGVSIGTGDGTDAGAFPGSENLTFHIDSIVAQ